MLKFEKYLTILSVSLELLKINLRDERILCIMQKN